MIRKCPKCNLEIEWSKCFVCSREVDGQLLRVTIPKEVYGMDPESRILVEDQHPICKECNDFKKAFDINFINLLTDLKAFEWYRAKSMKQGEYYPAEFVYNIDRLKLKEMYYQLMTVLADGYEVGMNDEIHKEREDEFNYIWRKKDE